MAQDQTLAQLLADSPVPAGAALSALTFYCTVTIAGVPIDCAITGAQLQALFSGGGGGSTATGGIGLSNDLSIDGLANH